MFSIIRPALCAAKRPVIPTIRTVRPQIFVSGSYRLVHNDSNSSADGIPKTEDQASTAVISNPQVEKTMLEVRKILNEPCSTSRFIRTVTQLHIPRDFSVLETAFQQEKDRDILEKVLKVFFDSPSARQFLIVELAKLSRIDMSRAKKVLMKLYQRRKGKQWALWYPSDAPDILRYILDNDKNLITLIINIALTNNLTTVAHHTFMTHKNVFQNDFNYQQNVLNSLILKNPFQDEYQLKNIVEFQKEFNVRFNQFQANQIMSKISQPTITPLVFKIISQLVIENSPLTTESYINTVYDLITREANNNNPESCAENWLKIRGFYRDITQHNFNILASLITIFTRNYKYRALVEEIVTQLPSSAYGDPILVVPLLEFATEKRRPDLANAICLNIQPPVSRRLLSSLLKLHVIFNDTAGTEKIFQEINKTGEPLSSGDYHSIVSQLLRKNEFTRALSIVQSIPIKDSESAYIAMINHIVDQAIKSKIEIPDKHLAIIDTLLKNMETQNRNVKGFWERVTGLYLKYLAQSKDQEKLEIAKQIYLNSTADLVAKRYLQTDYESSKAHIPGLEITYNPFTVIQNPERMYLKVSSSTKVVLLKTIADGAIKLKDGNSLNFALGLLGRLGFTRHDLINDFSRKYSKQIASMGFQITKSSRNTNNEEHQLNFMKKRKLLHLID